MQPARRRPSVVAGPVAGVVVALVAVLVGAGLGLAAPTAAAGVPDSAVYVPNESLTDSGAVILNDGHVDIASRVHGGTLETWVKDTTEGSDPRYHPLAGSHALESDERSATNNGNATVFQLLPESETTVPARAAYSFLGAAGDPVWQVSQTQQPGLLWPGWSTEEIPVAATTTGVQWNLERMTGPGEFSLYTTDPTHLGQLDVLFNTRDGITAADGFAIARNAHVHGTWAFSAPGTYCLGFSRSTRLADGVGAADRFTLAVAVGRVAVEQVDPGRCFADADAPGRPTEPDTTPVPAAQLTDATAGTLQVQHGEASFYPGQEVSVEVGTDHAGTWVSGWLHSAPTWLGWAWVGSDGSARMLLPRDADAGLHRLAIESHDGNLIGWDAVRVASALGAGNGNGGVDPGGPPGGGGSGGAPPVTTPCTAPTTIIDSGHLDYSTQVVNGKLESLIGDNSSGAEVLREPARTVLWLKPSSLVSLPAGYEQVGPPGANVYLVPQTQNMDLIWLGWSTQTLSAGQVSGPVTWSLTDVDGPGSVKVFLDGQFGGIQSLVFHGPSSYQIQLGVHAHANWAFSAPGIYRLHFSQTATLAGGQASSDSEVLTIVVGDVDPATAVAGGAACIAEHPPAVKPKPHARHRHHHGEKRHRATTAPATASSVCPGAALAGGARPAGAESAATRTTILSSGHMDWGSHIVNGRLQSMIGDDSTGTRVYREPSRTVLWLKPEARVRLPAGFAQVGPAGSTVWQIPQTQNMNLVWMGWSTELLNAGNAAGPVSWNLTRIDGPGHVKIYTTGSFGGVEDMVFDGPGAYTIALGVHAHANWAFSAQGVYRLHFTQSVKLAGGQVSTDSEVLTVAVGDIDPNRVEPVDAATTSTPVAAPGASPATDCGAAVPAAGSVSDLVAADAALQSPPTPGSLPTGTLPTSGEAAPALAARPTSSQDELVPILIGVLAGLLLVGCAGGGALWWQHWRLLAAGAAVRPPQGPAT